MVATTTSCEARPFYALVADGVAVGVPLNAMFDLVDQLRAELGTLADTLATQVVESVWRPLSADGRAHDVEAFLRRGRVLLLQGVVSMLADCMGDALMRHADEDARADELHAVLDRIRVGAIADADGNVQSVPTQGAANSGMTSRANCSICVRPASGQPQTR